MRRPFAHSRAEGRPREPESDELSEGAPEPSTAGPSPAPAPGPGAAAAARAARVARGERAVYGAVLLAAILVVAGLLAAQLVTLLVAVAITIIISLPLSWFAERLEPLGVPRPLGALLGLLLGLGAAAGLVLLLAPTLSAQANTLIAKTPGLVHSVEVQVANLIGTRPGHLADQIQHDAQTLVNNPSHLVGPIASIGLSAAGVVAGLIVAVISAYFIAARPQPLVNALLSLFPQPARADADRVLWRIRRAWLGWLRGVAISMFLIGLLLYLGLGIGVGLPFSLAFSVLSGIAEVIPYLGSLASGIPPVAFALTISPTKAVVVLVIYVLVHQIDANVISPLVMSRSVHLHPAVIAFGVVAVGEIFGFFGLIIAVPILSLAAILLDELWVRPRRGERALGSPPEGGG